jgi:deazaflavin-dependent oxidoreductase (nitroreductase family)
MLPISKKSDFGVMKRHSRFITPKSQSSEESTMDMLSGEKKMQQGFKQFNKFMLLMWRLGLGHWINFWPEGVGRIMVISHTGRKSGLKRQTPVNYAIVDGEIYCTSGFGKTSDWFCNIKANPEVEIWLPDSWWAGTVEEISNPKKRLPLLRTILQNSGFAASTFGGLDPFKLTDEELEKATTEYCVLRVHRTAARTGPGGPGDLAWVWPLATMLLLPLALRRRRR